MAARHTVGSGQQAASSEQNPQPSLRRRGILAAAGAIAAGLAAKAIADPVAANGTPLLVGQAFTGTNQFTLPTGIQYGGGVLTPPNNSIFMVADQNYPIAAGNNVGAVAGAATIAVPNGVYGYTQVANGNGVLGVGATTGSTPSTGVCGIGGGGGGTGVYGVGSSAGSAGVVGVAENGAPPTPGTVRAGVYGNAQGLGGRTGPGIWGIGNDVGARGDASNTSGNGVFGTTTAFSTPAANAAGIGVQGASPGIGVYGTTTGAGQYAVLGQTLVDNAFGLTGIANTNGSAAFAGGTTNASSFAASFQGHVVVSGVFDVFPMGNKHGLAQHPDGSVRTFYSLESPECWVEDFGEATLTGGKAEVKLDADFAALVHTDQYHVFLTEHGGHNGLHTTKKDAGSFTVEASGTLAKAAGLSVSQTQGTFSWRVVAKPKTTANVERLAKGRLAPQIDFAKLPTHEPKK